MYTGIRLLLHIFPFISSFFFLSNFQTKIFCFTFLRNCEAYKVETCNTRGKWLDISCIPELGCCSYSSFYFFIFFLSSFQTLKIFVTLFSGTVRPWRLKLGTHLESGQMYRVYWNQAAAAYLSLYFFIFLSLRFQTLEFFVTLFTGTVRPRRLKLGTHMDSGQMYHVYRTQAAAAYSSLYFSFVFLLR